VVSHVKLAFMPPPRSSVPANWIREDAMPFLAIVVAVATSFFALCVLKSKVPDKVTADCAKAAPVAATAANAIRVFFI